MHCRRTEVRVKSVLQLVPWLGGGEDLLQPTVMWHGERGRDESGRESRGRGRDERE